MFGSTLNLTVKKEVPRMESGEKLSKELLCNICIPLTEIFFSSLRELGNLFWRKNYQGTFGNIWTALVKTEISSDKNWKEAFCEIVL